MVHRVYPILSLCPIMVGLSQSVRRQTNKHSSGEFMLH